MMRSLICLACALALLSCGGKKEDTTNKNNIDSMNVREVVGIANIEPIDRILSITSEVSGVVQTIKVSINQEVKKGDILYILNNDLEQAQLNQAQSKLATQQSVISRSQTELATSEKKLDNATTNLNRNKKLFESNAITQKQMEDVQLTYDNAVLEVEAARKNVLQNNKRLSELQADVQYYQTLYNKKIIKAPMDGRILSVDTKIGATVSPGTALSDFAPKGPTIAITEIDELFADKIKIGQNAYIRAQGDTIILGKGKVLLTSAYLRKKSLFSDKAEDLEDRRVLEVRVQLDSTTHVLLGSRVECIIELK